MHRKRCKALTGWVWSRLCGASVEAARRGLSFYATPCGIRSPSPVTITDQGNRRRCWPFELLFHRRDDLAKYTNTHCSRGHEFTPENTKYFGDGRRRCLRCREARQQEISHCHAGHPFNKKNTAYRTNGTRRCRRCHADYQRSKYKRVAFQCESVSP